MAKVVSTNFGGAFVVEMGVGAGRANNRGDVTLVQYLLNLWIEHPKTAVYRQKLGSNQNQKLDVDGIFGPKTGSRIKHFQKSLDDTRCPIICDGRIDRIRGEWNMPFDGTTTHTICLLNVKICVMYCAAYHTFVADVSSRNDFPPSLKTMVSRYLFSLEL